MLRTPVLTQDQIDVFYNTGSLVVRGAFSPEEAKRIQAWTDELAALPEAPGRQWVFHEKSLKDPAQKLISRIEYIYPFHAGFKELAEALRAPGGQLLGEEAVLFKEKVNFKMPGGDGFKPHQDSQAGWDKYTDFFISVLVCIDEATVANGCLEVVSGHHKRGLFRSWEPMTADDMKGMSFVPVPAGSNSIVASETEIFSSFTYML